MSNLMKEYLDNIGINYNDFRVIARYFPNNIRVAGSAALWMYLKQEGIEPGFVPNDLDIWVRNTNNTVKCFNKFMKDNKYIIDYDNIDKDDYYYNNEQLNDIDSVESYIKNNNKVQLIYITKNNDLAEYMQNHYDLSCCASWWNADKEIFETMNPELTKKKEMYMLPKYLNVELNKKNKNRIKKYIDRGFTMVESPCRYEIEADKRIFSYDYNWDNIHIQDIITFEELPAKEYLKRSVWNMILKIGEKYYGFHRKNFIDMLKKTRIKDTRLALPMYDTPFRQTIVDTSEYSTLFVFEISDYSIYELVYNCNYEFNTITTDNLIRSIYDIKCYTVTDYEKGECSLFTTNNLKPKHRSKEETKYYIRKNTKKIFKW